MKQKHPIIVFLLATLNRRRTAIIAILVGISVPIVSGLQAHKIDWGQVAAAAVTVIVAGLSRSVADVHGSGASGSVPSPPADPPVRGDAPSLGNAPDDPPGSPFVDPPR